MEKIKLGVIGFGNMGTLHCQNIKNGKADLNSKILYNLKL